MEHKGTRQEFAWQVVGVIICLSIVTVASYLWRLAQNGGTWAVLTTYIVSFILMAACARIIFRRIVRKDYEQNQRLTPLAFFLQALIWGLFFALACIYNPHNWAWSQSEISREYPIIGFAGWACVGAGLVLLGLALGWLGISRSCGQKTSGLQVSGLYRLTRNPQLICGGLIVIGYLLLWPSVYALGWLFLYAIMAHMMVLTEEEFLRMSFGEDYEKYCRKVPRYLGIPGKQS